MMNATQKSELKTISEEPISPWLVAGDEKRKAVQKMFSEIAPSYDRLNRIITLNLDQGWRKKALLYAGIKPGDRVLDMCCGTGDFLVEVEKLTNHKEHLGIDFCLPMLEFGSQKNLPLLILGDACQIPIQDCTFDIVTVGWGIRNVPDIDRAHREIYRVLNSNGRFVSIDMAVPSNVVTRYFSTKIFQKVIPKLGAWLSKAEAYKYLPESTQRFWDRGQLAESMRRAGFEKIEHRDLFFGNICVHWGTKV